MAMAAWSAKVVTSSTCLSVKGWTWGRRMTITPITALSRSIGTARMVRCMPSCPRWSSAQWYSGSAWTSWM
jgi:hypothetical protein